MLSTAILVFREVLEAALIIGLVAVATRDIAQRSRFIIGGIVTGLAGAVVLAMFAGYVNEAAAGIGQELLNAIILMTAVVMLGWHNIWMKKHGRELAMHAKQTGHAVNEGEQSLIALSVLVGLAILREGAEVVLFLYSMIAAGTSVAQIGTGSALGLGVGTLFGAGMYFGLLKIPTRHLFKVTSILLLLLSAGLAAQAAGYLVQADLITSMTNTLWDTSWILSEHSIFGSILHTLVGYIANPMEIQLVFYFTTLIVIGGFMYIIHSDNPTRFMKPAAVIAFVSVISVLVFSSNNAFASHVVYSPYVEKGEYEIELRGHTTFDNNSSKDDNQKYKVEAGYGFTDYWFSAVYAEVEKEQPSGDYEHTATAWENIFQLTEQGEYWVDMGLYLEYEHPASSAKDDKLEGKLLLEKAYGQWAHTANIIFTRKLSSTNNATGFEYAWRTRYKYKKTFEPGFELYGDFGEFARVSPSDQQDHRAGFVAYGEFGDYNKGKWLYQIGYLFGLTDAAPDGTLKFVVEYEFR